MKHSATIFLFLTFYSLASYSQNRQLPATIDTTTINPEEIPSTEKLKALGLTDEEIKTINEFKTRKLAKKNTEEQKKTNLNNGLKPIDKVTENITEADLINKPLQTLEDKGNTEEQIPINEIKEDIIFGHSFFKNNNIKFYDKANQLKAPNNYILGIGDEINVAIWGYSDFSGAFTIDEDGAINPKLVGRIYLNGLTFKDVKGVIAAKFKNVYDLNNSQIDVTLQYSKVITVNIVGEVNKPGAYTIPSINTAFNALVTVGGISPIGSVRKIAVKRGGQNIKTLDVYEYLVNPNSKQDFFLENNDYIFIPPFGKVVKISGQVKRPLRYELIEKENLNDLIKYAGGFEAGAYKKSIQIIRYFNDEKIILDINFDSLMTSKKDFELYDGDEVLIRKIPEEYKNFVELIGPVKLPGNYQIKEGDRISDIIKRAEGVLYDVFDTRAYVIRVNADLSKKYMPFNLMEVIGNENTNNNIKLQNMDVIKLFSKKYFTDQFSFTVLGAVRSPGEFAFGEGITLKDALYLAGRLKKEASRNRIEISRSIDSFTSSKVFVTTKTIVKTVQIGDDLTIDKASENFLIQPFDQILVRVDPNFELQKNIVLSGEVLYPGKYTILNKKEKLLDIIERAGGLTQWAFPEGAKLIRKESNTGVLFLKLQDAINDTNSIYNYILKEGDSLNIPKVDQLIQISGLINYPNIDSLKQISAPFNKNKSARYYINNFGLGFSQDASRKNTYVIESGGYVNRTKKILFINFYPKVNKGSSIVVPKKIKNNAKNLKESEPINWNKQIENFTVKLTALATLGIIFSNLVK